MEKKTSQSPIQRREEQRKYHRRNLQRDPVERETKDSSDSSSSSSSSSSSTDEEMEEAPRPQEPPAMEDRTAKRQRLAAVGRSEVGGMGGG